jgi:hypothetical protein
MRILLILIVIAAIFVVVQSQRHDCKWGEAGWFDCVIGKKAETMPAEQPAPPPPPPPPAAETPAPETPAPAAPAQ